MEDCELEGARAAMECSGERVRTSSSYRRRIRLASAIAVLFFLILLPSFSFAAVVAEGGPRSALIRTGAFPGVRFNSGLTVCDEELRNGRWVSRYWDSTGQIVADIQIEGERQERATPPAGAV